jgi:predicted nucleic acid-binding protein
VPNPVVVDASPLIALAKANYLSLLHVAGDPVFVPQAVVQEVCAHGPQDRAAQAVSQTNWLRIVDPGPILAPLHAYGLDPGEAAVLTWALTHPGMQAVIDERLGRRCALALSVPCVGRVGLVIAARQQGVIAAARPVLEDLRRVGLYLSDRMLILCLAKVGE